VNLGSLQGPLALFDVEISQSCLGDSVRFINLSENSDDFVWNIGGDVYTIAEPIVLFEPGDGPVVVLTASNNSGSCSDSLIIDYANGWYTEDSVLVKYPNVFTPNGDMVNDCFKPEFLGNLDECFTLKIFSRWGRLLYDSEKHGGNCWDGTQRTDDLVAEGTYYYIANVRGMDHAGYVTVLYK
jgi:gliding motility-associated-like protein